MPDVYDAYKPLRNYLRNTNLITSLGALRWYINYFQFADNKPPPSDMQVDSRFYAQGMIYLPPWQVAVLARELIINSSPSSLMLLHDLRHWNDLANAINKLKAIDDYIAQNYVNQGNVYHLISKVFPYQQFVWQENRPNIQTMTRYFYIYRNPKVRKIFEKYFGLSVEAHFVLGSLAWVNYKNFLGLDYPPTFDTRFKLTNADYELFLKHYALTLEELQKRLQDPQERKMGPEFFYYFDSLRRYPMILTKMNGRESHICPVPTYLYWRVTDGIYYELINEKGFDQAIGDSFKEYIGEVMNEQAYSMAIKILDADTYVQPSLPKPDWIVINGDRAAFVECKAKRMTLTARTDVNFSPATEEQIKKLAESVIQCYLAINNARKKAYKELGSVKKIYPIVVTMENWYIFGDITTKLEAKVKEVAGQKGVDHKLIVDEPYLALSSREFETVAVLLRSTSLKDIIEPFFTDKEYSGWQFSSYLLKVFSKESNINHQLFKGNLIESVLDQLKSTT